MATTMTLLQLRTAVRQRADIVNSTQFFPDAELNSYINQSYFELYDLLVQKYGDNYFVQTPYSITTDGTNEFYNLPSDFYKIIGVDLGLSNKNDSWVTIKPFLMADRNRYSVPNFQSFYGVTNLRYKLNANQIWFTPIPAANQPIRLWYIPKMTTLNIDADTVDGISGWTEYIIIDVCIKIKQKEESDAAVFLKQKEDMMKRIESAAENRDAGSPKTVADVAYNDFSFDGGWNGSGTF